MSDKSKEKIEEEINISANKSWKCFIPLDNSYLEKSIKLDKDTSDDPQGWKLAGIASSTEEDLENEIVVPGGIDTEYFMKYGWINDNHQKGSAHKIGIPTKAEVNSKGLYIEAYLLKSHPSSKIIYNTLKELSDLKNIRRGGWSIEGKTILQEGKRIVKSWLMDVAFTFNPVNTSTYAELLKSLKVCEEDNSLESLAYLPVNKTLDAGYAVEGQTDGNALRVQDLEHKLKILTNKAFSPDEALSYVMLKAGVTSDIAKKILKYTDLLKKLKGC